MRPPRGICPDCHRPMANHASGCPGAEAEEEQDERAARATRRVLLQCRDDIRIAAMQWPDDHPNAMAELCVVMNAIEGALRWLR